MSQTRFLHDQLTEITDKIWDQGLMTAEKHMYIIGKPYGEN